MPNALIYYFTTYHYAKHEVCMKRYPDNNFGKGSPYFYENCALAFSNFRGEIRDTFQGNQYFDMKERDLSAKIDIYSGFFGQSIGLFAIALNYAGFKVRKSLVLGICFAVNTALGCIYIFDISMTHRYGFDYIAYIQHAQAFYHGETDYTKISSTPGPCYYPAGHLLHYFVVVWVHM
jgi:hypothetical protein